MNRYIDRSSEEEQLVTVKKNGYAIKHIANPSEAVQIAAVQQTHGDAILYINNPSEVVQIAAVQKDWRAIMFIKNPSDKVQLAAVEYLFKNNYILPRNITSQKAINRWNKLKTMSKACD